LLAGALLAALLLVAGGAIGPGRLAEAGPVPLAGMLAAGSLGLGGLLGGLGSRALGHRDALADRLPRLGRPRWPAILGRFGRPRIPRLRRPRLPWRHR
jgi:hypothetical protein